MKRYLSTLLLCFLSSGAAGEVTFVETLWYCISEYDSDPIKNIIEDKLEFRDNGKYTLRTSITFKDESRNESSILLAIVIGEYTYKGDTLKYGDITYKNIKTQKDDLGILTQDALDSLDRMLEQDSDVEYVTRTLTSEKWIFTNSKTNEVIECKVSN